MFGAILFRVPSSCKDRAGCTKKGAPSSTTANPLDSSSTLEVENVREVENEVRSWKMVVEGSGATPIDSSPTVQLEDVRKKASL